MEIKTTVQEAIDMAEARKDFLSSYGERIENASKDFFEAIVNAFIGIICSVFWKIKRSIDLKVNKAEVFGGRLPTLKEAACLPPRLVRWEPVWTQQVSNWNLFPVNYDGDLIPLDHEGKAKDWAMILPVVYINKNLPKRSLFVYNNLEFEVIDKNKALCKRAIGKKEERAYFFKDPEEVRKIIDEWSPRQ